MKSRADSAMTGTVGRQRDASLSPKGQRSRRLSLIRNGGGGVIRSVLGPLGQRERTDSGLVAVSAPAIEWEANRRINDQTWTDVSNRSWLEASAADG